MDNAARNHVEQLGRHGAYVMTAGGKTKLSSVFYDKIVQFCENYGINGLAYEMMIPETPETLRLLIWRDGHVDSGSAENINKLLDSERRVFG